MSGTETEQAEKAAQPLFPHYLDQGSTGAAVNVLGLILKALDFGNSGLIVLDGDYTPDGVIAEVVKDFQQQFGLEVDGNFGPATRAALKDNFGIDVDMLTVEMFTMPTVAAPL